MELSVVLDKEYTNKLKKNIENLIDEAITAKIERWQPKKRYVNRSELQKILSIGDTTLTKLKVNGLSYVRLNDKKVLFDLEEVYEILNSMKEK